MPLRLLAPMLLLAMALAGCGVRGPLEKPEEAKAADQAATDNLRTADPKAVKPPTPEHKPFILDPLIGDRRN